MTGPIAKVNPFRFSTKYQDDETDLLYYGYRYYNASTGKWNSRDPIEEMGGRNLYCFLCNSPVNDADLLGRVTVTQIAAIGDELGVNLPIITEAKNAGFKNLNEVTLINGDFTGLINAIQKKLKVTIDGDFGPATVAAYEASPGKVKLRDEKTAKQVLDWIIGLWPAEEKRRCPYKYGEVLALIHFESMDYSTAKGSRPTYFNAIGGPAGTKNLRTTAVGLGQFTIDTAPEAGLSFGDRYDAEKSITGFFKLLYSVAGTRGEFDQALGRWDAWNKRNAEIKSMGKKINELIDKKGDASNEELGQILQIK